MCFSSFFGLGRGGGGYAHGFFPSEGTFLFLFQLCLTYSQTLLKDRAPLSLFSLLSLLVCFDHLCCCWYEQENKKTVRVSKPVNFLTTLDNPLAREPKLAAFTQGRNLPCSGRRFRSDRWEGLLGLSRTNDLFEVLFLVSAWCSRMQTRTCIIDKNYSGSSSKILPQKCIGGWGG